MTKEQIVALAKEAGIPFNDCGATLVYRDEFFKFATLLLAQQKVEPADHIADAEDGRRGLCYVRRHRGG